MQSDLLNYRKKFCARGIFEFYESYYSPNQDRQIFPTREARWRWLYQNRPSFRNYLISHPTNEQVPVTVNHTNIGEIAKEVGGHGGMDFIMDWRLIDCLRNGLPLDQDVYDAAAWSSIIPLSGRSVDKRSKTVDIPDFTRGGWQTNKPVDLTLNGGANTTVRKLEKK